MHLNAIKKIAEKEYKIKKSDQKVIVLRDSQNNQSNIAVGVLIENSPKQSEQ